MTNRPGPEGPGRSCCRAGSVGRTSSGREANATLGLRTPDGLVEVIRGLKTGDALVVRGGEALKEGAKVRVGAAKPASAPSAAPSAVTP